MKAKKKQGFIDRFFLWVNILLCIALLLTYLAPVTSPATFWPLAFFGLAYPFLLLGNVLMICWWLFRKWKYSLLSAIIILTGWQVLNRNIGFRLPETADALKDAAAIRIMTYNVHNFKRYGSKNDLSTKQEILQIIKDEKPDVIGLQEFYTRNKGQYDMLDSIEQIMGSRYYYFEKVRSNHDEAIGMAIFSRFPVIAHGLIQLSEHSSENQCIYVDLKKGDKIIRFYSVHLQSIRFDPDDYRYLNNVAQTGDKPEKGSAFRLGSKLKTAFQKRSDQVRKIRDHSGQCPYPYMISGDFNDTPASFAVHEMSSGLNNAFVEKGSGFVRTYNGSFPNFQIDYILATKDFKVRNYKVIEKKLSDHYPVRSDLVL